MLPIQKIFDVGVASDANEKQQHGVLDVAASDLSSH